jgi:hypothetical protein
MGDIRYGYCGGYPIKRCNHNFAVSNEEPVKPLSLAFCDAVRELKLLWTGRCTKCKQVATWYNVVLKDGSTGYRIERNPDDPSPWEVRRQAELDETWLTLEGRPEIASECRLCEYAGDGFRPRRTHGDSTEYQCPRCHQPHTRRNDGSPGCYVFFPGDLERAFSHDREP